MIGFVLSHWEYFAVLAAAGAAAFAVMQFFPTKKLRSWAYGLILIAALVILGSLAASDFKAHYIAAGDTQCEDRHTVEKAQAKEKTITKQRKYGTEGQEVEDEARKQKGADAPASDYLRGILDRMRERN